MGFQVRGVEVVSKRLRAMVRLVVAAGYFLDELFSGVKIGGLGDCSRC